MSPSTEYFVIESSSLDYEQAKLDLEFSGIKSRLNGSLMVLEEQKDSAMEILESSQNYRPEST